MVPFKYQSKPSKAERNAGVSGKENTHPTLKSIKLNKYIMSMFKLPDGVNQKVYIPFAGVFSEVIGALKAGIKSENIYACEISEEYVEIGRQRLQYWKNRKLDDKKPVVKQKVKSGKGLF